MTELENKTNWRSVIEDRRQLARDNVSRTYEFAYSALKWVMTTTLVLNAAALAAALGTEKYSEELLSGPAWVFLVGVAFALFGGLALAVGLAGLGGKMSEALWSGEGIDQDTIDAFDPNADRSTVLGAALLGLALASFLVGAGYSGFAVTSAKTEPDHKLEQTKASPED
jgi:hypothetical protein